MAHRTRKGHAQLVAQAQAKQSQQTIEKVFSPQQESLHRPRNSRTSKRRLGAGTGVESSPPKKRTVDQDVSGHGSSSNMPKSRVLPQGWTLSLCRSITFKIYRSDPRASGPIASFDFDNTLVQCYPKKKPFDGEGGVVTGGNKESIMYSICFLEQIMSGLYKKGYRIVIFSNTEFVGQKSVACASASIKRKAKRIEAFVNLLSVPVNVYVAIQKEIGDGATSPEHAWWNLMLTHYGPVTPTLRARSFYVGTDGDANERFARSIQLKSYTQEEFFQHGIGLTIVAEASGAPATTAAPPLTIVAEASGAPATTAAPPATTAAPPATTAQALAAPLLSRAPTDALVPPAAQLPTPLPTDDGDLPIVSNLIVNGNGTLTDQVVSIPASYGCSRSAQCAYFVPSKEEYLSWVGTAMEIKLASRLISHFSRPNKGYFLRLSLCRDAPQHHLVPIRPGKNGNKRAAKKCIMCAVTSDRKCAACQVVICTSCSPTFHDHYIDNLRPFREYKIAERAQLKESKKNGIVSK